MADPAPLDPRLPSEPRRAAAVTARATTLADRLDHYTAERDAFDRLRNQREELEEQRETLKKLREENVELSKKNEKLGERRKKLKKQLDIPDEVLMTLPSAGDIEDRTRRALEKAKRRDERSQSVKDKKPTTEDDWEI